MGTCPSAPANCPAEDPQKGGPSVAHARGVSPRRPPKVPPRAPRVLASLLAPGHPPRLLRHSLSLSLRDASRGTTPESGKRARSLAGIFEGAPEKRDPAESINAGHSIPDEKWVPAAFVSQSRFCPFSSSPRGTDLRANHHRRCQPSPAPPLSRFFRLFLPANHPGRPAQVRLVLLGGACSAAQNPSAPATRSI